MEISANAEMRIMYWQRENIENSELLVAFIKLTNLHANFHRFRHFQPFATAFQDIKVVAFSQDKILENTVIFI